MDKNERVRKQQKKENNSKVMKIAGWGVG